MDGRIKNGQVNMDGTAMEYVRFGSGGTHLIFLPGLGDGLKTVRGTALPMAFMYRAYARRYTVWMMSRKNELPERCSTRDMANDVKKAMVQLGIPRAHIVGVSMGGMIAQFLAADHPDRVERLVLAVTCPCANRVLQDAVSLWIVQAEQKDHRALMADNLQRMYSAAYIHRNGWMVPVLSAVTKPASYDRFLVQARACINHDARAVLPAIAAPTLIIGGGEDQVVGCEGSHELYGHIARSQLHIYPHGTHALYEEEKDFHRLVLDFLGGSLA